MSELLDTVESKFVTVSFSYKGLLPKEYDRIRRYLSDLGMARIHQYGFDPYYIGHELSNSYASISFKFEEDAVVFKLKFNICYIERTSF